MALLRSLAGARLKPTSHKTLGAEDAVTCIGNLERRGLPILSLAEPYIQGFSRMRVGSASDDERAYRRIVGAVFLDHVLNLPSFPSDPQRSRAHAQSKRHFMLWLAISKQSTMTMDRARLFVCKQFDCGRHFRPSRFGRARRKDRGGWRPGSRFEPARGWAVLTFFRALFSQNPKTPIKSIS